MPKFPLCQLEDGLSEREAALWTQIWGTPQAVAWVRLGWTHEVALYVRLLVLAEVGDAKAAAELRQWSDRLGLNPAAMLRNRWRIARDQVSERRTTAPRRGKSSDVRDRLKAINGGGA